MADLIDRQAAIDFIDAGHLCNPNEPRWSDNEIVNFLKSRPSAQPEITLESAIDFLHSIGWMQEHDRVLTERKTGRWTPIPSLFRTLGICSVCHNVSGNEYEYCPWCGAKMEVADGE